MPEKKENSFKTRPMGAKRIYAELAVAPEGLLVGFFVGGYLLNVVVVTMFETRISDISEGQAILFVFAITVVSYTTYYVTRKEFFRLNSLGLLFQMSNGFFFSVIVGALFYWFLHIKHPIH